MRFGIGLIALLMGVGLMLWLQADHAQKTLSMSKPAREAAVEIAGQDMRGSYDVQRVEANGKVMGLKLTRVDPRSPLLTMYDIKEGDEITQIGPFDIKDYDVDLMKAQLEEVGHNWHRLTVLRDGQKLELDNHGKAAQMGGRDGPKKKSDGDIMGLPGGVAIPTH